MFSIIVEPNSIPTDSAEVFIFLKTLLTLIFLTPYAITVRFILFGGLEALSYPVYVCVHLMLLYQDLCVWCYFAFFFFFAAMFILDVVEMNV